MVYTHDLTDGSILRHLLRLAAPLILGNILQQLYNTVDALILGRFAGEVEFAAVGVAGSVMNLFLFVIVGGCTGVSVILAQLYGAGELAAFRREHWLSLVFGCGAVAVGIGAGLLVLPPLLGLIQTPAELTALVSAYLRIILISLPAAFFYNHLYGALLRAIGRANAALLALAAAVIVNLALDYLFIARARWGIAGAAWATAISQAVSAALCVVYLRVIAVFYTLCFTGNTFAGYFDGVGRVSVPLIGAASHIALRAVLSWLLVGRLGLSAVALATGIGWLMVNGLWETVRRRSRRG